MSLLEVKNLQVRVEEREILHGLSLAVNKGEVHAIMGPNGSGKSTLSHVIAGKPGYEVTGGEILFRGENLLEMSPDQRAAKGVFLAFQYPVEIPGVATMNFLRTALNAQRKARGEFYSIAISNGHQQVDSGTKMIHLGKNTTSRIISKGIAAGHSNNTYRGLVSAHRRATNARNFTNCDSLLIGDKCGAHTVPYIEAKNSSALFEHEATTSKISEDVLFYCVQRGLSQEEAVGLVVNGFVKDVLQQLPMEFAVEAQKLISISLEGSVG